MRKLSTDALLVFGSDIASRAIGFLATAYVVKALGLEVYGVTVIGTAFLSYVLWFTDLGLGTLGTREMGKGDNNRTVEPSEVLSARLTLSLLVVLPAAAVAFLLYRSQPEQSTVLLYILTALPYGILLEWYFQGIGRFTPLLLSRTLTAAINLVGLWLLVSDPHDVARVPLIFVASYLLPALLLFFFARPQDRLLSLCLGPRRALATLRKTGGIGFGWILAQTVQLLPPLVLGAVSTDQTGALGAATRIAFLLLIIDRVVGTLYLPRMAHLLHTDRAAAQRVAAVALRLSLAAGGAIVVGTFLSADEAVRIVYDGELAGVAGPLVLLSLFVALTLVNSIATYALIADHRERVWLRATIVGAVGTGVLALLLTVVWKFGAMGGAGAMVGGELLLTFLAWRAGRETLALSLPLPLLHALLLTGVVGGAAWLLHLHGLIAGGAAALVLLALALGTRLISLDVLKTMPLKREES